MKNITIEFFHDVLCSFCFPMSYNMRKFSEKYPDINIVHRSFALLRNEDDFKYMSVTREEAKDSIVSYWPQADELDELHRFNVEGMKEQSFLFPISMPALYACKAAGIVAGQDAYWDVFDNLQYALFAESKNVGDDVIIRECVKKAGLDLVEWEKVYKSDTVKEEVEKDFKLVDKYNIDVVPTLIINGEHKVSGAKAYKKLLNDFDKFIK